MIRTLIMLVSFTSINMPNVKAQEYGTYDYENDMILNDTNIINVPIKNKLRVIADLCIVIFKRLKYN